MKNVLLDTHTLLWLHGDFEQLSDKAKNILLQNDEFEYFVSHISFWEIAIKNKLGKLPLSVSVRELIELTLSMGIQLVNISIESILKTSELDLHHRDPFDRMLIAQAIAENMPIISADTKFDLYPEIHRIW